MDTDYPFFPDSTCFRVSLLLSVLFLFYFPLFSKQRKWQSLVQIPGNSKDHWRCLMTDIGGIYAWNSTFDPAMWLTTITFALEVFFPLKDIDNSNLSLTFQLTSSSISGRAKSFLLLSSKSIYPLKTFQNFFRNPVQGALTECYRMKEF